LFLQPRHRVTSFRSFVQSFRRVRWAPVPAILGAVVAGATAGVVAACVAAVVLFVLAHVAVAMWEPVLAGPLRAAEQGVEPSEGRLDRKTVVVLVTSAVCVTLLEYLGMSNRHFVVTDALRVLGAEGVASAIDVAMREQIHRLTWWAGWCVFTYFVVPSLVIVFVLKERVRDYGFRVRGALDDAWVYGIFLLVMLPIVAYVSEDPHFQQTYPFYDLGPGEGVSTNLVRWEILYALQFLTLEFFFRGFMVHGTRHRLGGLSVFVMMVPYCMIHFGKPMPETIGAIIAGIVLGALSLKTRSIWLGVAIHVTIAWTMDAAVLWRTGVLG
jgi:uncharacterized protein